MINCVSEAMLVVSLELSSEYVIIWIVDYDGEKIVCRTYYSQFEYSVMPFVLTHSTASPQAYINDSLVFKHLQD